MDLFLPVRETKLAHTRKHPVDEKGRAEKQRKEGGKGGAREHRVRRERVSERDGPRLDRGRDFRAFCLHGAPFRVGAHENCCSNRTR